jgi:hypothetical protein
MLRQVSFDLIGCPKAVMIFSFDDTVTSLFMGIEGCESKEGRNSKKNESLSRAEKILPQIIFDNQKYCQLFLTSHKTLAIWDTNRILMIQI